MTANPAHLGRVGGLQAKIVALLATLSVYLTVAPLFLCAQGLDAKSWKSFDLIYYNPAAPPNHPSPFNLDPRSEFTTEMRIEYLRRYAEALAQRTGAGNSGHFAFDVVSAEAVHDRARQIKEKPIPKIRPVVPLKYWRWKLEPDWDGTTRRDVSWVGRKFDDERLWNALETPRLFFFNRAVLLRTHFRAPSSPRVLLSIGSIIDVFEIWVNGRYAGQHSGFEPVLFDIGQFVERGVDNTLAIRIANKPKDQIGIADEICVLGVPDPYLSDVFLKTESAEAGEAGVTLEIELTQVAALARQGKVKIEITPWFPEERRDRMFADVLPFALAAHEGAKVLHAALRLRGVDLWSPDSPHLYLVLATLEDAAGNSRDDLVEVAGLRRIEQREGRLFLNGKPWFMKSFGEPLGFAPGFNFSSDIAPPDEWIVRDFMLARRANANTIRIHPWGHTGNPGAYSDSAWPFWGLPNSSTNYQRIAWIADQLGIGLTWGTRLWTTWSADFENMYVHDESFESRLKASLRLVRNRPSILVYEGLNEVGMGLGDTKTTPPDYPAQSYLDFCKRYFESVNRIDDSRMILPDTPWGPLEYSPYPKNSYTLHPSPLVPAELYAYVENTFWTDHNYFGWYRNLPEAPLLAALEPRPVVLYEAGAEAMPDWNVYRGMRWNGIWLNNGGSAGSLEKERLGRPLRILEDSEVNISQANQGLSIAQTVFATRFSVADGININLIADGLAEGNYHKGVCDIYRKAKLGYFAVQMAYQPVVVMGTNFDFVLGSGDELHFQAAADAAFWGSDVQLTLDVADQSGAVVDHKHVLSTLAANQRITSLGAYTPHFSREGFYLLQYTVTMP